MKADDGKVLDMATWLESIRKKYGLNSVEFSPERELRDAEEYMTELGVEFHGKRFTPSEVLSVKRHLKTCKDCAADDSAVATCSMGGYHPVLRPDDGRIHVVYAQCLRRMEFDRQEEMRRMMETIPVQLQKKSFKTFRANEKVSESVREAARIAWKAAQDGRSLVLAGDIGTGKTHLAAAVVMHAIGGGKTALFSTTPKLMSRLKSFGPNGDYQKVLNAVIGCDVLALDDLGVERYTDWISEQLFTVINDRYLARRQTIITTNLATPEDLIERMDYTEWRGVRERIGYNGERIVSRICEMGEWVRIVGEDQRLKRAQKQVEEKAS